MLIIKDLDFCETQDSSSTQVYGGEGVAAFSASFGAANSALTGASFNVDPVTLQYSYSGFVIIKTAVAAAYAGAASDGSQSVFSSVFAGVF